jgi:sulfur carrier protein
MTIRVNGETIALESPLTVSGLLKKLNILPERVAVEANLTIIKKNRYGDYELQEGDVVEIVNFVGGG